MKKLIFLGLSLLFAACQPFSFDEPRDKRTCRIYLDQGYMFINADEIFQERMEGYLQPMFYPNRESEILFIHRVTDEEWKIIHLGLESREAVYMANSQRKIMLFDMNEQGDLLWVDDLGGLFVQQANQAVEQVSFPEQIIEAKWANRHIAVYSTNQKLHLIDINGTIVNQLPSPSAQWRLIGNLSVSGDGLIIEFIQDRSKARALYLYQLSTFQLMDSLDLSDYGSVSDNSLAVSDNWLSIEYLHPNLVILSRPNRIYSVDLNSDTSTILWERESCLVTEPGIALSPRGDALIAGCSRVVKSPINTNRSVVEKERGLMLLQDGFTTLSTSYP